MNTNVVLHPARRCRACGSTRMIHRIKLVRGRHLEWISCEKCHLTRVRTDAPTNEPIDA